MGRQRDNDLVRFVRRELRRLADPKKAVEMAAYLKTDMPFYGVQKPRRLPVYGEITRRFPITTRSEYRQAVTALWSQPHREEKYAAVHVARSVPSYITVSSVGLYEQMIRQGAWWDLVDGIAVDLVGHVLLHQRRQMRPRIDKWIDDHDMWIRRAALLSQISHKSQTDDGQLFSHCLRRAHEKEFFIRKAIGWALREYACTAPDAVARFLRQNRDLLSALSFREAAKHLDLR
jgi:3-methyladenine DNA glycosylase AlkD